MNTQVLLMIQALRLPLTAGYIVLWLFLPPRFPDTSPAKVFVLAAIVVGHVLLGVLLRTWWACALALVPVFAAVPQTKQWPLFIYYVPPIALMIGVGVLTSRMRGRRRRA